jgi:flagellar hook-associated protein 2
LGAGSIAVQVGSGSATTIAIASGQSSLDGIANAIDQANAGVEANVLYDGSSYHLVLTGDATGTANAFTVSGAGGLSALSYSKGASGFSEAQAAANAAFSLNGIAITSGSNTITGVVPGLTLTLAASGSATVQVTASVAALDQGANSVVSAINTVLGTINQYASYSTASGAGPLFGNVGLEILRSSLLEAIASPAASGAAANSSYGSLAAAGFSITSGGTVTLDDATFQGAAQSDYSAVASLVAGFYGTMSSVVNSALASGSGGVTSNITSLNSTIGSMNQQIAILQQQAQQETLALTQQYSNAEATLSQLQTVSDFLTTYFNQTSGGGTGG